MRKLYISFGILVLTICLWPRLGQAADLRVSTDLTEVKTGEYFTAVVSASSDESINAVEGWLTFPDNILYLDKISDGDSQMNLWIERPHLSADGVVRFAGITPGGLDGSDIKIFTLTFKGLVASKAQIILDKVKVYKNDGLGTLVAINVVNQEVSISDIGGYAQQPPVYDFEPPESFVPAIASDKSIFDGKNFLVFSAQDKGQGIAYYQLKESRSRLLANFFDWRTVSSPYILADQELKSYVWIRAVDRAGNIRQIVVSPTYQAAWYENFSFFAIIIVVILLAWAFYLLWGDLWKSKQK